MRSVKAGASRRRFLGEAGAAAGGCVLCGLARMGVAAPETTVGPESVPTAEESAVGDPRLGYCGLYCAGCQSYQETVADKLGTRAADATCLGCASNVVASWCRECAIKTCNRQKGIRYCLLCNEYPCDKLMEFTNDPRYPYHKAVHPDMARLKEVGLAAWLEEQSVRWVCARCGGTYHWFARTCPTCNTRVNQQYWPD